MKPPRTTLLLFAALASVGLSASERPFTAQLIDPAPQVTLVAGSTATIGWDATGIPENFDEWEAFLSLDGGRSYPLRITPHLDLKIRSFTWSVPPLPVAEGSILLRFGDEREERRFAFARRFRIAGSLTLPSPWSTSVRANARGEAAEPEAEGVVAWIDGPRDGSSITQVAVNDEALSSDQQPTIAPQRPLALVSATQPRGDHDPVRSTTGEDDIAPARLRNTYRAPLDRSADILLITHRRNI